MNATQGITIVPLFPRISWLDIILPPLLILLSLLLHTIYSTPPSSHPSHSHLFHAKTAHARFLPVEAKHVFSYPVLFYGLDLDQLESGQSDLGPLFGFRGTNKEKWRLTALSPSAYLDTDKPLTAPRGIKEKLLAYLEKKGVEGSRAKSVYTVTMPAYLGFEGINPLTVHYCYSELSEVGRRKLEVVVLEVHNTFGERHIYLLRTEQEEDIDIAVGYEHQWTFPRSFHVSPFNDRTGFYRVSLTDPLSVHLPTPPSSPTLSLKIIFLTSSLEKKLYASLAGPSVPLSEGAILSALLRWPISLLLTTPRILYQAMRLHYSKQLDVFPRPEPFVAPEVGEVNPVEEGGKEGAIGWSEEGGVYRDLVRRFVQRRVDEMYGEGRVMEVLFVPAGRVENGLRIVPSPSSSSSSSSQEEKQGEGTTEQLRIDYLTPMLFSDLITSPTISLALAIGSQTEQRWSTTNDNLFLSLLTPSSSSPTLDKPTWRANLLDKIRHHQFHWALSFSPLYPLSTPPRPRLFNPLTGPTPSLSLLRMIVIQFFVVRLGYWIFVATGARFVSGMETWMEWARWYDRSLKEKGTRKYGSVLHH